MNPMIERVAKAVEDHIWLYESLDETSLRFVARAAIAAMREPTPEMMFVTETCEYEGQSNALRNWQRMIDEALK